MRRLFTYPLRRFLRSERAVSAVEFTLATPLILLLLLGTAEVARYLHLRMKLQNTTASVSDLITRARSASTAEFDDILEVVPSLMQPFDDIVRYRIVVTGVAHLTGETDPEVVWRRERGALAADSILGDVGDEAPAAENLVIEGGDALVVTEVFYQYDAWLFGFFDDDVVEEVAFSRPRRAPLTALD
jgi:hypothetical protein